MAVTSKTLLGLVACASFTFVDAFWRMNCGIVQNGRVDPIVNPGAISSHAHMISGPSNFGLSSTYDTHLAAPCTSCEIQQDKSAYWTPQLYYKHANGSFEEVKTGGTIVYYLGRGVNRTNIEPFPRGFRMLSGDNGVRRYENTTMTYLNQRPVADRVSFACLDRSGPMKEQPYMFRTDCSSGMRAQIHFQSCWDGINLWKPDQSHVAYMSEIDNGRCPPTHPHQFAHVFLEVLYSVNNIDKSDGGIFTFANGDATGYAFHGDFQNGWDMDVQTAAMKQCINTDGGSISACPPLKASQDPYFPWNCPEQPPVVNERVHGWIDKLPGCNTVTGFQNARASNPNCPAELNTLAPMVNTPKFNPTPRTMMGSWSYMGCAKEAGVYRALSGPKYGDSGVTIDKCQAYCMNAGQSIAGLEYGRECWCGNSLSPTNPIQSPEACAAMAQMVCSGNSTQYCGGPNLITLWNNTAAAFAPTSTGSGTAPTTPIPTPAATSSVPVNTPTVGVTTIADGKALYVGCYSEVNGRTLSGAAFSNTTGMTNELCASYCMSRNYALFGTEFSQECYCASSLASASTFKPQFECSLPCKGDASQRCGGPSRLSLWNNTNFVAPRSPPTPNNQFSYIGCFTEGNNARALGASAKSSAFAKSDSTGMTVEMCASICFNKGYNWMGVEYGQECYCNQDGPINNSAVAPNGENECNMLCKGNNTEYCGAGSRLNVYRKIGSASTNRLVNTRSARFARDYKA